MGTFHFGINMSIDGYRTLKSGVYLARHPSAFLLNLLVCSLLDTIDHKTALRLIDDERVNITAIAKQGPASETAATQGIAFLDYMVATWMPEPLWQGWSRKGRTVAAALLKIPIKGVLPTTNHLESFNGLLKQKYIPRWQRTGARIRFDFLIHILISRILPEIYSLRRSQDQYLSWVTDRFKESAGGVDLTKVVNSKGTLSCGAGAASGAGLYWFEPNERRDGEAIAIINLGRMRDVRPSQLLDQIEANCATTSANLADPNHTKYNLSMYRNGVASCSCQDFRIRGGACKHLRALCLVVITWARFLGPNIVLFSHRIALSIVGKQKKVYCQLKTRTHDKKKRSESAKKTTRTTTSAITRYTQPSIHLQHCQVADMILQDATRYQIVATLTSLPDLTKCRQIQTSA